MGRKTNSQSCTRIRDEDGKILEGKELADFLGNYYATNGENLAKAFQTISPPFDLEEVRRDAKFALRFVPLTVIEQLIREIDIGKSSGILGISTVLLKDAFMVLSVELAYIINESIRTAVFPDAWAVGTITPIPKEGETLDPGNWRPITILPLPSKLLEKVVHYQIISYLDDNNYLSFNQHGFRKGKSTSTAILETTRVLMDNYNRGKHTSCVFVDYKKAFETLDHKILLRKLIDYDFDSNSIKWIQSYLGNRRHVVKCSEICSMEINVKYGVPQGSVLGPLYFIMYVNDLISHITDTADAKIVMYADDTVLMIEHDDPETAVVKMQDVLRKSAEWCYTNKLTINPKKTKHMLVLRNKDLHDVTQQLVVNLVGETLSNVPSYRYLGVDLDYNLTYEEAVNTAYLKANKKLFTLRKIRPYICEDVAALIYKQFILPILDYADFLFDSATKRSLDSLDRIQKRAVRIIGNFKRADCLISLKYNLIPLKERRRKHHLALMYRISRINLYIDDERPEIILRNRNKIKFKTPITKLTKVLKSPFYRGARLWDMLTEDVQRATTKVKFKQII